MEIEKLKRELTTEIRAKYPLIVLETYEEQRAIALITEIGLEPSVRRKVFVWTHSLGLKDTTIIEDPNKPAPQPDATDPIDVLTRIELAKPNGGDGHIYILLDFHKFTHDQAPPVVVRKIRDLAKNLTKSRKTIIFISPEFKIPTELQKSVSVLDLPLPSSDELKKILTDAVNGLQNQEDQIRDQIKEEENPDAKEKNKVRLSNLQKIKKKLTEQAITNQDSLITAGLGLTGEEYENTVSKSLIEHDLDVTGILNEKKQIIRKTGTLEYLEPSETMADVGGLEVAKKEIAILAQCFSEKARNFGIKHPRGILFVGAPGTGKTLLSKVVSNVFHQPLLIIDMAGMTSKYLGETGNRMKGAIKIAKSLTPNIVMIDEIDKQFGSSGREEHEENARARSALLSAMEESEGIFWIATCNHPELLAPELLARFQLIFHVDLPSKNERKAIITIHLKKAGRDPKKYNLDEIANASDGHVGRGIRDAIQAALRRSFSEGKTDLTTEYIIDAIKRSKSTYDQRKEEIDAIRVWCIKNAIDASERDIPSQTTSKSESGRGLDIMDQ